MILIIGALGNLASLTARALASLHPEIELRLTSHRTQGVDELRKQFPRAEVAYADWNDAASLREAVRGVDRLLVVMTDFVIDESIGTTNLIRALQKEGRVETVLRFIALPPGLKREQLSADVLATRAGAMLTLVAKPLLEASKLPICYVNAPCWITFNIDWFFAQDIREHREIRMPAATDMPRQWVCETDLAEVFVKILTEPPQEHVDREYRVNGGPRYTYAEQARLVGEVLGEKVAWVDDDSSLRRIMGARFDQMMTYLLHEVVAYRNVTATRELEELLGRPRTTLREYVASLRAALM